MIPITSAVLSALLASSVSLVGDTADVARGGDLSYDGAAGELQVATPRLVDPGIAVDGRLDETAWASAAVLEGFTQYEPSQGVPASQRTETSIFVTDDAIYVGVRAWDTEPANIRATLSERDGFTRSDDWIRVVLDTFHDQQRAYVLTVNPYGVQHDGLWVEGGGERRGMGPPIDDNPDFLWESDARVEAWGWSAEMRIPFKSLRFPDRDVQSWGVNVIRRIQRSGFEESWAPISGDVANRLTQSGALTDLRRLDPGLFLELNPVLTGKRLGEYDENVDRLEHGGIDGEFGMNFTYGVTSNLTLDATVNPDFSQVEADAGQIAVNERFALRFPEKRPFFLEGTEVFSLPAQLVYTRSIVNPIGGAKLTGKVGGLTVGYLGAVDEGVGDPDEDDDETNDVVVNLLRVRQDLGGSSSVGGIYTDRTASGDDYNRVAGVDTRLLFARRYTVSLLGAASWTGTEDEDDLAGRYVMAKVERAGRSFSMTGEFEDAAPDFRAQSGFLRRIGDTRAKLETRYNWYGEPGALVEQVGPTLEMEGFWDHDRFWDGESLEEGRVSLGTRVSFRNNITIFTTFIRSRFDFPEPAYDGLATLDAEGRPVPYVPDMASFHGLDGGRIFFFFSNWERVRGTVRVNWGRGPIFDRSRRVPVELGSSFGTEVNLDLFPTPRLTGQVGLRHESIDRVADGSRYSSATIPRLRAQYQFTRSFFVRTIVEYASEDRRTLRSATTGEPLYGCDDGGCEALTGGEDHDIHVEGLISYEPSPGTVVFLGYTRDMIDEEAFGFRSVQPRADGLFAKVSYRFRF